jgi:hypothetical protein
MGLAALGVLLSKTAEERPLICLVDDAQWLDRASAQVLGFVARRLPPDSVGVVLAVRIPGGGPGGTAGAYGGSPAAGGRAGAAGLDAQRVAGCAGAGPDPGRDAGQPAGALVGKVMHDAAP